MDGGCACGGVRFALLAAPMIVHACHCTFCQRETGSAFAVNAVIETANVRPLRGAARLVPTPSASGGGQEIARCPACEVALWSHYPNAGRRAAFVRVGALDAPGALAPDVHIHVASRLPWVVLPPGVPAFAGFYPDPEAIWAAPALARWRDLTGKAPRP